MGLTWDKTFVDGKGLRLKSGAKLFAYLGRLTWRPNPGPLSCDPRQWLKSETESGACSSLKI